MKKFKIIFSVEESADGEKFDPDTNKIAVEKSQMTFEVTDNEEEAARRMLDPDFNKRPCFFLGALAEEGLPKLKNAIEKAKDAEKNHNATEAEKSDYMNGLKSGVDATKYDREVFLSFGFSMSQHIRKEMRKWAQKQQEAESVTK